MCPNDIRPNKYNQIKVNIMKKSIMLLVAVLATGEMCEAEMNVNDSIEDAKNALCVNYYLEPGSVKSWEIRHE